MVCRGKYGKEIRRIVEYLKKAAEYACNAHQKEVIELLIRYYETGDLSLFDRYSIEWVKEVAAPIDFINGFIEVYGDPLAYKASWESVVQIMDEEACKRTRKLADNAMWFERNAPIDERFKKSEVVGITAEWYRLPCWVGIAIRQLRSGLIAECRMDSGALWQ